MPDFDIDQLKKTWKEQEMPQKYAQEDIRKMLNQKSRNYVKYIFWISLAEFCFFLSLNIFYIFQNDSENNFIKILQKLGVKSNYDMQKQLTYIGFLLKIISLGLTGFFMLKFYLNYQKINIEADLKRFILQIIKFRKTVNIFIIANIVLVCFSILAFIIYAFVVLQQQNIFIDSKTSLIIIFIGIVSIGIGIAFVYFYYKLAYGILSKRLGKQLNQLIEIEQQTNI